MLKKYFLPVFLIATIFSVVLYPSWVAYKLKRDIETILTHAEKVSLEELFWKGDTRVELLQTTWHKITDVMAVPLDFGFSLEIILGEPACLCPVHHRIVITNEARKEFVIGLCFTCNKIYFSSEKHSMPYLWQDPFIRLFESYGINLRKEGDYIGRAMTTQR